MRPHASQRNHWAQLGIYACALLLPPLALGAALYSMLPPPEDEPSPPAAAQAAGRDGPLSSSSMGLSAAAADGQVAAGNRIAPSVNGQLPIIGPPAAGMAQRGDQQATAAPGALQGVPFRVSAAPAVAPAADAQASAAPVPAEGLPAAAAPPKRARRNGPRHQPEQYPLKVFLQRIGILPRDGRG
jgi:hypothetical protein